MTSILPAFTSTELIIFLVLLIIGIVVILILKAVLSLILPIVAAVVVWFATHNLIYAGVAFVVVAILQMILRRR